jgi:hypothetical protein
MYTGAIIGYLSWPFMILVSYLVVNWAMKYFERKAAADGESEE